MDERVYRYLKYTAIVMAVAWIGWAAYDGLFKGKDKATLTLEAGQRYFSDGLYNEALGQYEKVLKTDPSNLHALRGAARSMMQLGHSGKALETFDEAIDLEPEYGASYANRGILNDRMGRYKQAIEDYEKAVELNQELGEGPGWLTRFLRNQAEQPATITQRAAYLREQLAKPEHERVLRVPPIDAQQRAYNQ